MKGLVLHTVTKRQLKAFINSPSHAVMLVGATGIGKSTLAINLAAEILAIDGNFDTYPYKLVIDITDGKSIGIEAVRQLEHFLSLKVPRQSAYNRVVIFENAQALTLEAQNALLKTLEEPPEYSLIILNVSHEQALLPTIRSRAQTISVKLPQQDKVEVFFKAQNYAEKQIQQALAISGGLPGLMHALLEEQDHPLFQATEQARRLLSSNLYERLLIVDELAKERDLAQDTTFILQQMASVALQTAEGQAAKRWQAVLEASYKTAEALNANAQPKLALTNLCLSF